MTTAWSSAALKLLLWGALMPAMVDSPPAKYDHAYAGPVQIVWDFPYTAGADDFMWGWTKPPKRPGGVCVVHLSPIGSVIYNQVMTQDTLLVQYRHEIAHCNGWLHD
jgi:hypothetical protein